MPTSPLVLSEVAKKKSSSASQNKDRFSSIYFLTKDYHVVYLFSFNFYFAPLHRCSRNATTRIFIKSPCDNAEESRKQVINSSWAGLTQSGRGHVFCSTL